MRLFLAQSAVLDDYPRLRHQMDHCLSGRWRTSGSLHATVLFTGEKFSAARIIDSVAPLRITLENAPIKGIGRFARNHILYAAADHPGLLHAHTEIAEALGMTAARDYTVHVTMMRYKKIDIECFEKEEKYLQGKKLGTIGGPLKLMESVLTSEGARYETLYEF